MTKPWQIWLVLIAIFAAGTTGGWLVARHAARRSARHLLPPEGWAAREIERVADEVQLTPEQKERIKPIVAANIDEMMRLRRQALDIADRMEKQIAAELTPEQRTKYEQILQERRAARKQAHDLRDARHQADDAPPGGGPPPAPAPEKGAGS